MRVLFVCGFNPTVRAWYEAYDPIRAHFDARGDDVEYFVHTWAECAPAVYARLCATLARNRYDAIVAHSFGGTLVARYLAKHPAFEPPRVVLCMPLLTRDSTVFAALSRVPLLGLVPVPKALGLPAWTLHAEASPCAPPAILKDLTTVFCGQQIKHAYRYWLGPGPGGPDDRSECSGTDAPRGSGGSGGSGARAPLAAVLERDDVHLVYASREMLTPIANATLARAAHVHRVEGCHEDFGAPFLAALDRALA